ncbi:14872_t:CDS:1, partial [Rhizophagus irregularis]
QVMEKDPKRDAENAKLGATIEELKSENAELRDRVMKVEQNQVQNDSKGNITLNNNSSNFNLDAVHHEKP